MTNITVFPNKHKIRILLNMVAWFFLANATYNNSRMYAPGHSHTAAYITHIICFNLVYLIAVAAHNLWMLPRLLLRRKTGMYLIALITELLVVGTTLAWYSEYLHDIFPGTPHQSFSAFTFGEKGEFESTAEYITSVSLGVLFLLFLFAIGWMAQNFFVVRRQKEEIERKQLAAELNLLKSQINPHFLFNVLNSIYSLSLKKSDKAPEMVLKLSDLLRYMLYDTKQDTVRLEQELTQLRDYLAIEKVRIGERQQIELQIEGLADGLEIAPLMLVPFVENAVKHGLDSISEQGYIRIRVTISNGILHFECANNYKTRVRRPQGGIGLENVRRRLQLIYPHNHTLYIRDEDNIFTVALTIKLKHELSDR
jgi:two-component system, LytTR family, sensor kinase